ncbi:MAG: response regulator [Spongiibacteraceae bacterium]
MQRSAARGRAWIGAALTGIYCLLACVLPASPLHAAPALVLDREFQQIDLANYLDVLDADAGSVANPQQLAPQFHPLAADNLGPSRQRHWLRFGLINPRHEPQTLILQVRPPADAKALAISGSTSAALVPLLTDRHDPLVGLYEVRVPARASVLFYLRTGGNPLTKSSLQMFSLDHFLTLADQQSWLGGAASGLLAMLLIIALICALLTRDRIYLGLAVLTALHLLPALVYWRAAGDWGFAFSRSLAICWILASSAALQITLQFPAWPSGSRRWPQVLRAAFVLEIGAAIALALHPAWLTFYSVLLVLLPATLLTAIAPTLACFQRYDRALLTYAAARGGITLAGVLIALIVLTQNTLGLPLLGLVTACAAIEILLLMLALMLRTLDRIDQQADRHRAVAVAEAESRARTESTAAMAHRIRTPVSGVLGMIEMLQDTPLSAAQHDSLDTMQRAGSELLNAVNEMSDISRLDFGGDPLQRGSFDLHALIAECVEGFRGLASSRALELITDFAPGLPRYVSGDQTRLRQLLLQLMHHALSRFRGGEILLRVDGRGRRQHFALTAHGNIATELVRPNMETDPALRLAIARQLIATLDGSIHIPQITDNIWRVSFELSLAAIERMRDAGEPEQNLRHRQLLIIDDSATFREVVQRQASHWGMHVHGAATLSEGLARLNNQHTIGEPVELLLLDAELPELADIDSHSRLREAGLPRAVILLSTLPEAEHALLAQTLAVRRVLLKPIDQTSLQLALLEEINQPLPQRHRTPSAAPLHCLIAEDNPINAQVLQGMLSKLGATHATAVNGQEAVETFQRQTFDIVFMDCDMPVMDGFEAAQRIREIQQNRGVVPTPIIALTANTLEELGERARTAVMDAHLVKPVRLQSLRELLAHWTGCNLPVTPN